MSSQSCNTNNHFCIWVNIFNYHKSSFVVFVIGRNTDSQDPLFSDFEKFCQFSQWNWCIIFAKIFVLQKWSERQMHFPSKSLVARARLCFTACHDQIQTWQKPLRSQISCSWTRWNISRVLSLFWDTFHGVCSSLLWPFSQDVSHFVWKNPERWTCLWDFKRQWKLRKPWKNASSGTHCYWSIVHEWTE